MKKKLNYPKYHDHILWRRQGKKTIIISPDGDFLTINETASEIWKLCDGKHTYNEITSAIAKKFSISMDVAQKDVADFLNELHKRDLISFKKKRD